MIQEYIVNWLNTYTGLNTQTIYSFSKKVEELHKKELKKQLTITDVGNRRELLQAFKEYYNSHNEQYDINIYEFQIDDFINSL